MTERQQVRVELMKHAKANLSMQFKLTHTDKQIRAACKIIVDRSISHYLKRTPAIPTPQTGIIQMQESL